MIIQGENKMALYVADTSQASLKMESGTFGVASGGTFWLGLVQEVSIDENTNPFIIRQVNSSTRSVSQWENGPLDVDFSTTLYPQDWRFLYLTMGSVVSTSGVSSSHAIKELNSGDLFANLTSGALTNFPTFTIEDAHVAPGTGLNFVRTINGGMVDSMEISISEGEMVSVSINGQAQNVVYSSGAATAVTAQTLTPYLWQHCQVHIPSGTMIEPVTEATVTISNNLDRHHYINGSRVIATITPINRDYEISVSLHGDTNYTKTFYDSYFIPGSEFNMMINMIAKSGTTSAVGTRSCALIFSGCKLIDMEAPTAIENITEQTLTINAKNLTATVIDGNAKLALF